MSGDSGEILQIRPLTKTKRTGELYERRPEVEEQLRDAVRMPFDVVADHLALPNKETPGYLYDETLVYLLREAHRREDPSMEYLIYDHLAGRVEVLLRKLAYDVGMDNKEDFIQDIHVKIIEKVFDLDTDKSDYAQVMFGDFVTTLGGTERRNRRKRDSKEARNLEIDAPKEDGYDYDPPADDLSQEQISMLRNALDKIPERTAAAFVLNHIDGLQIESKDPIEPTVARYFGVSGRTIRNWFKDAVRILNEGDGEEE